MTKWEARFQWFKGEMFRNMTYKEQGKALTRVAQLVQPWSPVRLRSEHMPGLQVQEGVWERQMIDIFLYLNK